MKPRILFVDHAGVLGGAELYLLDVARHYRDTCRVVLFEEGPFHGLLASAGVDVRLFKAPAALRNVARHGGKMQGLKALPGVFGLVGRLARAARSYDVLYANSQKALIVAALAGRLARRPVIWNLHDVLTADHFSAFNRKLAVWFANTMTARVIVNSRATREAFGASGGRVEKTRVVYNGLDAAPFRAVTPEAVCGLRRDLGLAGLPVVGVFSRLAPWKGQHVLIQALAALPDVHAILVGDALFGTDDGYVAELHALAGRLGVDERVHFLGFRSDVPALMKAVDVVAHTSVAPEPFGRVIVEGMLARKPVVASRAGGALEIVEEGRTGLLVPPDDPDRLAEALARLFREPKTAQAMAEAGEQAARTRFAVEKILGELEEHVQEVVAPPALHPLPS